MILWSLYFFYQAYCHHSYLIDFSFFLFTLKKYKMHIDRNTGIIEMFMDKLLDEDEGTYTFQLQDGRATGHSTLVLIGDGKNLRNINWKTLLLPFMKMPQKWSRERQQELFLFGFPCLKYNSQLILPIAIHYVEVKVNLKRIPNLSLAYRQNCILV